MPKIGKRILKSSLAVFLCLLIHMFRQTEGIVFYSCIAAVLCIQQDVTTTKRVALNRIKGTFLGGIVGMFTLLFIQQVLPSEYVLLSYFVIALMIIPIIYSSVVLHMTSVSYISCVVFMSITVSHAMDMNPYLFAFNRILDTLIGIFVAFLMNGLSLPHHEHKDSLFIVPLEKGLCNEFDQIPAYVKIKLKQLLEKNANICIRSQHTPAYFLPILKDIPLNLPVIAMNGAALYDINKQEYEHSYILTSDFVEAINSLFHQVEITAFVHTISNHMLHVYYDKLRNPVEEEYYHNMRKSGYENYICQRVPKDKDVVFMYAIDQTEKIQELYIHLSAMSNYDQLQVTIRNDEEHHNYQIIELCSRDVSMTTNYIKQTYQFQDCYVVKETNGTDIVKAITKIYHRKKEKIIR